MNSIEKQIRLEVPRKGILDLLKEIIRIDFIGTSLAMLLFLVGAAFEFLGLASLLPVAVALLQGGTTDGVYLFVILRSIGIPTSGVGTNTFLLMVVGAMMIRGGAMLCAFAILGRISAKLECHMSSDLLNNLLYAKWQHILEIGAGAAIDAVSRQAAETSQAANCLGPLLSSGTLATTLVAAAFILSPGTVGSALLISIPLLLTMRFLNKKVHEVASSLTKLYQERNRYSIEVIQQTKYIKAAHVESAMLKDFGCLLAKIESKTKSLTFLLGLGATAPDTLIVASVCIIIALVAANASDRSQYITLALILLYRGFQYASSFQTSRQAIIRFLPSYNELVLASAKAEQMRELPANAVDMKFENNISFDHVSFAYDHRFPILHDFSIRISKGDIILLQGPSGAGKSTVADLLVGLLTPQQGLVLIDDTPLKPEFLASFRKQIAYIPQEPVIFNGTIRYNLVRDCGEVEEEELNQAVRAAQLDDVVQLRPDGLDAQVGERGLKLSGGQKQRLALARAFLRKAQLIILDEATNAVDSNREQAILDRFETLDRNITFLIITHGKASFSKDPRVRVLELAKAHS